jgi:hypothetical protein
MGIIVFALLLSTFITSSVKEGILVNQVFVQVKVVKVVPSNIF